MTALRWPWLCVEVAVRVLDDGSLVVDDLPAVSGAAPDGRAAREALVAPEEREGEQVGIRFDQSGCRWPSSSRAFKASAKVTPQ